MTYELYGYAPDPESVECFQDFEEAAARCEELVHEDGYDSGEVWADSGDLVYRVGRRPASLGSIEPGVIELPRTSRRRADAPRDIPVVRDDAPRAIPVIRDDDRGCRAGGATIVALAGTRTPALAAAPPVPASPRLPAAAPVSAVSSAPVAPWVLGDRTTAPTLWFGTAE